MGGGGGGHGNASPVSGQHTALGDAVHLHHDVILWHSRRGGEPHREEEEYEQAFHIRTKIPWPDTQ